MNICQDEDIKSLNIATDPFCNPYTGISTSTLTKETEEVVEYLANSGEINTDTEDPMAAIKSGSKFESYVKNCVNRENPIGVGEDSNDMGLECSSVNNPNVAYYAAYLTDVRIQDGMDKGVFPGGNSPSDQLSVSGSGDFIMPIKESQITGRTPYGTSSVPIHNGWHNGLDLWANTGTPIYSIADGEVTSSGYTNGCGAATIEIKHINDVYATYCHNNTSLVKTGDSVKKGQQIGTVGNEGFAKDTVPHLHLEVTRGKTNWSDTSIGRFDPMELFK